MPVPRYERNQQPTALPGVRGAGDLPLAAAGGASAAPASAALSQQSYQMAEQAKKQADDASTQDAWAKLVKERNRLTYDPQRGLLAHQGTQAQYAEGLLSEFDASANEIEKGLGNEVQREMFRSLRGKERQEFDGRVTAHIASEGEKLADSSFKSATGTAIEDGILNYKEPGKVASIRNILKATIMDRAEKQGWDSEMTQRAVEESVSQMHKGIVFRELANNNDRGARDWYSQISGEVTGHDAIEIEARLKTAGERGDAVRLALNYADKFANEGLALDALRKDHGSSEGYDRARAELKMIYDDRALRDYHAYDANLNEAISVIDQGGTPSAYQLGNLTAQDQKRLEGVIRQKARGEQVQTDNDMFLKLKRMAANEPDKFMREALGQYYDCLSPADYKDLKDWQLGMAQRKPETQDVINGFLSEDQVIINAMVEMGASEREASRPKSEDAAKMRAEIDRRITMAKREGGKKTLPSEDLQKIVHDAMFSVRTNARLWERKVPAYKLKVDQIPGKFKDELDKKFMAAYGRPAYGQEYIENYIATQQREANAD